MPTIEAIVKTVVIFQPDLSSITIGIAGAVKITATQKFSMIMIP